MKIFKKSRAAAGDNQIQEEEKALPGEEAKASAESGEGSAPKALSIPLGSRSKSRALKGNKSKLVFHFNTFGNVFLEVSAFSGGNVVKSKKFLLEAYRLENGALSNPEGVAKDIAADFDCKNCDIDLLISSDKCFKHVLSYPKINPVKVLSLYRRDIKSYFPDSASRYKSFVVNYSHPLGHIYITGFIPLNIVESFQKLALLLGSRLASVDMYTDRLFRSIKGSVPGNCSYIFAEDGRGVVLNIYGGNLTASGEFSYSDVKDVVDNYLLIVSGHEFEYERALASTILVNSPLYEELNEALGPVQRFTPVLTASRGGGTGI